MGDNLASGGSSPSREVQEILQDYDKDSYSGDDLLEEDENEEEDLEEAPKSVKSVVDSGSVIKTGL